MSYYEENELFSSQKQHRPYSSLSLPVGEVVFVMYKEVHEEDIVFADEVLFHLNMVQTCQFHTEFTALSICTKSFIEN